VATVERNGTNVRMSRTDSIGRWGLLVGGASFFAGGSIHPRDDPPGLNVKELVRVLYEDPSWEPSHALLVLGFGLIAASLVALARGETFAAAPRVHTVSIVTATAAALAALATLLQTVAATEADSIAADASTPLTDVSLVLESLGALAFGISIAVLAVVGALTRTIGNRVTAPLGIAGGVAYMLAGGTVLFTEALNFLFPLSAATALWAVVAAIGLLRRA